MQGGGRGRAGRGERAGGRSSRRVTTPESSSSLCVSRFHFHVPRSARASGLAAGRSALGRRGGAATPRAPRRARPRGRAGHGARARARAGNILYHYGSIYQAYWHGACAPFRALVHNDHPHRHIPTSSREERADCDQASTRPGEKPPPEAICCPPALSLRPHAARARFDLLGALAASSAPRVRLLGAPSISGSRGGGTRGAATGAAGTAAAASERAPARPRPHASPPRPRAALLPPLPRAPRPRPRDVAAAARGAPRRPVPEALLPEALLEPAALLEPVPAPALAPGLAPVGLRCHGGTAMPHSFCRWVGRSPSETSFLPA